MSLLKISNKVVGDAIANLFVIEAILYDLDMSIQQFDETYTESPSRMYKIKVADRTKFTVTEDESRLTFPTELQDEIDKAIAKVKNGKAFVRASGTEDVIRLYCEAETLEEMESMAGDLQDIIDKRFKGNFWEETDQQPKQDEVLECNDFSCDVVAMTIQLEIKEDRLEEFYKLMQEDAVQSRKEEGCLRFDLLRSQSADNKFTIYEAYAS